MTILRTLFFLLLGVSVAHAQQFVFPIVRLATAGNGPTNITANGATGAALETGGFATFGVQVSGTYTGTLELQCSIDGTNYHPLTLIPSNSTTPATEITTEGVWFSGGSCTMVRVRSTAWTSGTAVTTIMALSTGGGGGGGGGGAGDTVAISQSSTDNDVDVASSALPTGASTSAKQDTQITHLATLAGGVSSNKYQVDCITGCAGGTSDTDDASIATGQTTGLQLGLTQIYDGSAWKRLTLGTAGAASAQVMTVQGVASMTPILATLSGTNTVDTVTTVGTISGALPVGTNSIGKVSDITTSVTPGTAAANLGKAEDAAHTSGDTGVAVLAKRTDTAAVSSGTDGDYSTLNVDSNGRVWANIFGVTQSAGTYLAVRFTDGSNFITPAEDGTHDSAVKTTGPQVMYEAKDFDGAALPNNVSAEGDAVRGASSLYGVRYTMLVNEDGSKELGKNEDTAHADADYGMPQLQRRIDTPASSAGTSGDYATANQSAEGAQYTTPIATTAGGTTTVYTAAGASTNATNVKAGAGNVYHYTLSNTTTTVYYLRLYNLASSPTCSSSTGFVETIPIPPAASAGLVGGREIALTVPQSFSTGVAFCITGGAGSTDNTNAASGVYVTVRYK